MKVIQFGIFGVFTVIAIQSASAQMGFNTKRPANRDSNQAVVCDLKTSFKPSAAVQKIVGAAGTSYACQSKTTEFEATLIEVRFDLDQAKAAGSNLKLTIDCTSENPSGAYLFGARTIGFQTSKTNSAPWFYNPNPRANGGRCFVNGDQALIRTLKAETNISALVLIPKTSS